MYRSPRPPSELSADAADFRSPEFRAALVAAAALVIHADGRMASAERSRFLDILGDETVLAGLRRDQVLDDFAEHAANFRFDPEVGAEMARERLCGIAGRTRLCAVLVRICRAIIPADGVIHPAEHRALAEIRSILGVTAQVLSPDRGHPAVRRVARADLAEARIA